MKVVILAGGFGTRLSEYTDNIPNPMVPIGNEPKQLSTETAPTIRLGDYQSSPLK